jgi:nonsense-mediated mRNA decay protein 3
VFDRPIKNSAWKKIAYTDINDPITQILETEIGDKYEFTLPPFEEIPSIVNVIVTLRENKTESKEITLLIKHSLCKTCNKFISKRFDAVIQLRTIKLKQKKPRELLYPIVEEIIDFAEKIHQKDAEQFISDIEEHSHGFDLKLSIKSIMTSIQSFLINRYAFIVKYSKKLMGKNPNTGGDLYRSYILLRYIPFQVDSRIRIQNDIFTIKKIQSNRIILEDINTNNQETRNFEFFEKKLIEFIDGV